MSVERRIYRRKKVNAKVLLIHPEIGEQPTYTHDISNAGVFVLLQNHPDFSFGTELNMHFLESKHDEIVFKMRVARMDKQGLGLAFLGYEKKGKFYNIKTLGKN